MKELGTIEQEAADCRAAFANSKVGDAVWLCHHGMLCEPLSELPENRISYILSSKSRNEQARRLREFRPVRGKLPAEWDKANAELAKARAEWDKAYAELAKARAEWDKARAEWDKARAEWAKAGAEWDKAGAEWDKAGAEWDKAKAEWDKAGAEFMPQLMAFHAEECPDSVWNGQSLF